MATALFPAPKAASPLWSVHCEWTDLTVPCFENFSASRMLRLNDGWTRRWTMKWKTDGGWVTCPVSGAREVPMAACRPVRRFSWRTGQRNRPGLQYMDSTGRHHGFESIEEQTLLLALDFAGAVREVLAQPFRLRFTTLDGWAQHIPDFLASTSSGTWLIDVRPAALIEAEDRMRFSAAAEAALACGWSYIVVGGWKLGVATILDALCAGRGTMTDPLGLRELLLEEVAQGPVSFARLADATPVPAMARAMIVHLLWRRQFGIDLAGPLLDRTPVRARTQTATG